MTPWAAPWPEEKTAKRVERCRAMLVALGLIDDTANRRIKRRLKQHDKTQQKGRT